jgi:hypothetical protein
VGWAARLMGKQKATEIDEIKSIIDGVDEIQF